MHLMFEIHEFKHCLFNKSIILSKMNSQPKVVISVPRLSSTSNTVLDLAVSPEQKGADSEDRQPFGDSLKMLGSFLNINLGERKNSAFSIYDPCNEGKSEENQDSWDNQSQSVLNNPDPETIKPRKWKKTKRSKRQMNRLETKNLNRYFRSKINEMLRDIKENSVSDEESQKAEEVLYLLNKSNNIMFSQLRQIIKDEWLHKKLTTCSGVLLKYIHKGKMGTYSKMIMLKYYNKIMKAIRNPDNFSFWK